MGLFKRKLSELSLPDIVAIPTKSTLNHALEQFSSKGIGAFGLTDESGKIVGILSERDLVLRTNVEDFGRWDELLVEEIMTSKVISIEEDKSVADAMNLMARMEFRHLPILSQDRRYKMMSARDILDLVIERYRPLCEKLGTLTEWETEVGHVHEEDYVFHGQKDSLETGTFLYANMKEIGGSDMLKVDTALPIRELWGAMKAAHLPVAAVVSWSTLLCGIITDRDLILKVFTQGVEVLDWPVSKIMTENPHSMLLKHHLVYALNNMATFRYRNILIVDEDRFPILITELVDFLKFFRRVYQNSTSAID